MTEVFVECADEGDGFLRDKQFLTTNKHKWKVIDKIGEGGYGSVYKVQSEEGLEAALKVERKEERRKRYKLEMEVQVLKELQTFVHQLNPPPTDVHFTELLDKAKKENFAFLVMELVGESLADLRRQRRPPIFTLRTAYTLAIKTLEPVRVLHQAGYLHRDIKPANYAIGKEGGKRRLIYMLDFGIARKYLKENGGSMKTPREKVGFKGTVRYASLACHEQKELGPKDDLESWLYMCIDLGNPEGCNWRGIKNKEQVYHYKKEARTEDGKKHLFIGIDAREFGLLLTYVDALKIIDKIDYEYPVKLLQRAAKNAKISLDGPYDWEEDDAGTTTTEEIEAEKPDDERRRKKPTTFSKKLTHEGRIESALIEDKAQKSGEEEGKNKFDDRKGSRKAGEKTMVKSVQSVYILNAPIAATAGAAERRTSTVEKCTRTKSIIP